MVCIDFFFSCFQQSSFGGQWRSTIQHSQPLGDHFQWQGDCTGRLLGGSLSSNNCNLTQTDSNHSQTDWRSAKNCSLIFKHRQSALMSAIHLQFKIHISAIRHFTQLVKNCLYSAFIPI